jgi:methyl-accepting chemotaxis protein
MKLSTRLSAVACTALALCFAALAIALLGLTSASLHGYFGRDIRYKASELKVVVAEKEERAKRAAAWFESSLPLAEAAASKSHDRIVELGTLAMSSFGLDYFVVTDSKGVVIARAHQPESSGDSIADQLNVKAALEGRNEVYLEEGAKVGYSIRAGSPLRAANGKIVGALSLGYVLSSEAFVDSVKALFGCEASVFNGSTRIATTIMQGGHRIVGTEQKDKAILDKVLVEGGEYYGVAKIEGDSYFVAYTPLVDADKHPSGMLFLGNKASVIDDVLNTILEGAAVCLAVNLAAVGLIILISIRRSMRPLELMTSTLASSENDLRLRFEARRRDEVGLMGRKLNAYFESMSLLVGGLKSASQKGSQVGSSLSTSAIEVGAVVEEIGATIKNVHDRVSSVDRELEGARRSVHDIDESIAGVSKRLEEQETAVQESSSSIEELVGAIESINKTAQLKRRMSDELSSLAERSEGDMAVTMEAIQHLDASARSISELVEIIQNVASQTNLLAMNAAIEAAHAGQFGRGFSVVADEIRKLAETTADSAKLIKKTIQEVDLSISKATESAETTHSSLDQLVMGTKDLGGAMNEIGLGMGEMSAGSGQIVAALSDLVRITRDIASAGGSVRERTLLTLESIEAVARGSGENSQALGEIVEGLKAIIQAMESLKEKGAENSEILGSLEGEMARFKV